MTSGAFDSVPVAKIKEAQAGLLTQLWNNAKDTMRELNKGAKPTDEQLQVIDEATQAAAKGFEE